MQPNLTETNLPRVVIIGGGFAGLKLATTLNNSLFQIVLLDKNNFHQFQPLFYQVATAGLEPSAIAFPFRKIFQNYKNFHFRETTVKQVLTAEQIIDCTIGKIHYDYLIIAIGTDTNYYKIESLEANSLPMKTVSEALKLRNVILENFEYAVVADNKEVLNKNTNIVIVGGGPTGVELAGALADLRNDVLPKDYPEIDFSKMKIQLIQSGEKVLQNMSSKSSRLALRYLEKLGVEVRCGINVESFSDQKAQLSDGSIIQTKTLIWAAGVRSNTLLGFENKSFGTGNRLKVNQFNIVTGFENIFAIGDSCQMVSELFPEGHPQLAQVAIQQAKHLSKNLAYQLKNKKMLAFKYKNKGTMATIGRNLAVVDLPFLTFGGFFAWLTWMFVHLMSIVGVKNRFFIFINWMWSYFTKDQSLRLLIRPKTKQSYS